MTTPDTDRSRMAAKIAALLAQAEGEAKAGNESAVQAFLDKAAALQLKYAIGDAMLAAGTPDKDEIIHQDFCQESNTPLIKAKRELIASLAVLYRGKAILMAEWQPRADGKGSKLNRRAKVRVYAHESDLAFISQLYTSLLLQMQTMMAADEREECFCSAAKITGGWRVSYAFGYVRRVYSRLLEAKRRTEREADSGAPGTALVLRDRYAVVLDHVGARHGQLRDHKPRTDDNHEGGRAAGRAAGDRADIGQRKVSSHGVRRLEA